MAGFLRPKCNACGKTIYLKEDSPGCWRPYESWVAGTVSEGEWVLHRCCEEGSRKSPDGEVLPADPAVSSTSPPRNMTQHCTSIDDVCTKFMLAGMSQGKALDLISKMCAVMDALEDCSLDRDEAWTDVFFALNYQAESFNVLEDEQAGNSSGEQKNISPGMPF
jgi:hypothetical protein